jgi:hypothetical protein
MVLGCKIPHELDALKWKAIRRRRRRRRRRKILLNYNQYYEEVKVNEALALSTTHKRTKI